MKRALRLVKIINLPTRLIPRKMVGFRRFQCKGVPKISGDCSNIYGDITNINGDVSNIFGEVSNRLFGDVSYLCGSITGVRGVLNYPGYKVLGDISYCELTLSDRIITVDINQLIGFDTIYTEDKTPTISNKREIIRSIKREIKSLFTKCDRIEKDIVLAKPCKAIEMEKIGFNENFMEEEPNKCVVYVEKIEHIGSEIKHDKIETV